ncbi:MAG: hypothetical protein A2504_00230 [Bdellovibrionales bacterium RIFOXYD12_FULL_39_22]|nr:MAG: hypothetical protein A2485_03155 [Bdellovibrionales bacterium RIFOXYC12_FULL_39_17]OFZ47044.1 MAG: hypothetical protein A2404_08000 [Bdellovibrionales bacterium RIFOXYC1_FULL_39_130]OFZ76687.1 MAG: hypothetical protein A2560_17515 [Bdellovibrionales bacterium RIFOXYD1_FULL_39_84]OFZ95922.1 MAG: hypothetical protein A2504_00230 [Bdellovibrionales bacterium RIFOXYD12_FULL_39_22]
MKKIFFCFCVLFFLESMACIEEFQNSEWSSSRDLGYEKLVIKQDSLEYSTINAAGTGTISASEIKCEEGYLDNKGTYQNTRRIIGKIVNIEGDYWDRRQSEIFFTIVPYRAGEFIKLCFNNDEHWCVY